MNNAEMRAILGLDDSTTESSLTKDPLKLFKIELPTYLRDDFSSAKLVRKKRSQLQHRPSRGVRLVSYYLQR